MNTAIFFVFSLLHLNFSFQDGINNTFTEAALAGRLKEYFAEKKTTDKSPEMINFIQNVNTDSIKTNFINLNKPEISLELFKSLGDNEKAIIKTFLKENVLVYILGNYKGGLLDSQNSEIFLKKIDVNLLEPNYKFLSNADKQNLFKNILNILTKPEMEKTKNLFEQNKIDTEKIQLHDNEIMIFLDDPNQSKEKIDILKNTAKKLLEEAASDKEIYANKNLKHLLSNKSITLVQNQITSPDSKIIESLSKNLNDFLIDPSNKELLDNLKSLNVDTPSISFNEMDIVIPLKKDNSEAENHKIKILVRNGLNYFAGNYNGGLTPQLKNFLSSLNILILRPIQNSSHQEFQWVQETFFQPVIVFSSQGCFWRKKTVPLVFNVPVNYWVLIQKNYVERSNPVTYQPGLEKSPVLTIAYDLDSESALHQGKIAYQEKNFENSLAYINHSISKNPVNTIAWHYRAVVLFELGDKEKAIESAKRAGSMFLTDKDPSNILIKLERIQGAQRKLIVESRNSLQKDEIALLVNSELPSDIKERKLMIDVAMKRIGDN